MASSACWLGVSKKVSLETDVTSSSRTSSLFSIVDEKQAKWIVQIIKKKFEFVFTISMDHTEYYGDSIEQWGS